MKAFLAFAVALGMVAVMAAPVAAAPFNAYGKNPNIVEYHPGPDDVHAIIGVDGSDKPIYLEGKDLVMAAGKSGNFQQWYENGIGYHSVWRHVGDQTHCPGDWVLVEDARDPEEGDTWGYHLEEGNYCVKTNAYKVGHGHGHSK
jgi:hypothetical protein